MVYALNVSTAFVTYRRVSTQRQGQSGLGLDAQDAAIQQFAKGCTILAEATEIETGKRADRPELQKAIELCKRTGATLLVAKLDRLARNVEFTATLMNSGIDFVACDNPNATRLTIHILAAVAEDEARRISDRTKAALAQAKKRGKKLGASNPSNAAALMNRRGRYQRAPSRVKEKYTNEFAAISALKSTGKTYREIAAYLNANGQRTLKGKLFTPWTIHHIINANLCVA